MKKENKKGKNYFLSILTILLCLFIFLRVWYDGISEPFINTLLVFYIFFLTLISYLYRKEKTENLPLMYMPFSFLFYFLLFLQVFLKLKVVVLLIIQTFYHFFVL